MKPQTTRLVKRICFSFAVLCLITAIGIEACVATERTDVIVGFNTGVDRSTILLENNVNEINYEYSIINAVAVSVNTSELNRLSKDPAVAYIEPDMPVYLAHEEKLTWNIERIGADRVWGIGGIPEVVEGYNTGAGVKVAVIDTGIDADHPDLMKNIKGGYNVIDKNDVWNDGHGHGTHVSGIVAAINNKEGVIGTAPDCYLYAVKVFDDNGHGRSTYLIAGLDWVYQNDMDVATMSLRTSESYSLKAALQKAYDSGIVLVAASGNCGSSVSSPAAYDTVISVGATLSDDTIGAYSNRGPEMELVAPGRCYSTYKDGLYTTMGGTSMAAPHVAGAAALVLDTQIDETYDLNNNGVWDPAEVRKRLADTSRDLGDSGWDQLYGYGLVDAYRATIGFGSKPSPTPTPLPTDPTPEPTQVIPTPTPTQPPTDWNPWDDDFEITNIEISLAEWHWATDTPKNGHIITNADISLLEYQWATDDFS